MFDRGYMTQLKQKERNYIAEHRHVVSVLTSNVTFSIFAVLFV